MPASAATFALLRFSRTRQSNRRDYLTARRVLLNSDAGSDVLAAAAGTTGTYTGVVSGGNPLVVGDGRGNNGTVVLTENNVYSGGTVVLGGATLSVAVDSGLGDPAGSIVLFGGRLLTTGNGFHTARTVDLLAGGSGGILSAARGTTANYSGIIFDSGILTVDGPTSDGTVVLSGANTYSGGTVIDSATLLVNNAQALGTGDVAVNTDGVLGGTVRPINVLGNYTQSAGGTLQLRVAGASVGEYDSLSVRGNVIWVELCSCFPSGSSRRLAISWLW